MPTTVFLPQKPVFAPPARWGAGVFSALAPIVVSGSTLPEPLLSEGRWCRGLGRPQGWGGTYTISITLSSRELDPLTKKGRPGCYAGPPPTQP